MMNLKEYILRMTFLIRHCHLSYYLINFHVKSTSLFVVCICQRNPKKRSNIVLKESLSSGIWANMKCDELGEYLYFLNQEYIHCNYF